MQPRKHLSSEELRFIYDQRVARLATADASGDPHAIPVCYAFDGTYFYTPLDQKPKRVNVNQLRRVHNIEARHEVSLLIDHYDDDWSKLGYVLIHGQAELLPPGPPQHAQALVLLRERYVQYISMALETLPIIVIAPDRVVSWGPAIHA